jgi:endonuclease YncB( thermonuclease family)
LPGPIPAEIVSVIDGDTVAVRARIWPGQFVETRVRVAGIDTPEKRGPDCEAERTLAEEATRFTQSWLQDDGSEPRFFLHEVETGSFAGRVIADIARRDGSRLSEALLEAGLAVAYGEAAPWCTVAVTTSAPATPSPR